MALFSIGSERATKRTGAALGAFGGMVLLVRLATWDRLIGTGLSLMGAAGLITWVLERQIHRYESLWLVLMLATGVTAFVLIIAGAYRFARGTGSPP